MHVWEADKGKWKRCIKLRGHQKSVKSVGISGDGRRIVSGSGDRKVCLWDANEDGWKCSEPGEHQDLVRSVGISRDGRRVVSGSDDHTVRVWDADKSGWKCPEVRGHQRLVTSVERSGNGRRIVSKSFGVVMHVWNVVEGGWRSTELRGHQDVVQSVEIREDGRRIVSVSDDCTVRVGELEYGKWVNSYWNVESLVPHLSVTCMGTQVRMVILRGARLLYCDWEWEEETELALEESVAVGMMQKFPTKSELLRMVDGKEIWQTPTGCCIKKNVDLVCLYSEH